jgi:hypothetical protein
MDNQIWRQAGRWSGKLVLLLAVCFPGYAQKQAPPNAAEIEKWRTVISQQYSTVVQMPPYNGDWRSLVSMKLGFALDRYQDLYLAAVNRRGLAAEYLAAARKFLDRQDIANTQKYFNKAARLSIDSDNLARAANSVYAGGVGIAATELDAIYQGAKAALLLVATLQCSYACYDLVDHFSLLSDYAVDTSLRSRDMATRNAILHAVLLSVDFSSLTSQITRFVGQPASTHVIVDQLLQSPNLRSQIMSMVGRSAIFTTNQLSGAGATNLILAAMRTMNSVASQIQFPAPTSPVVPTAGSPTVEITPLGTHQARFTPAQMQAIDSFLRSHPGYKTVNCQTLALSASACTNLDHEWESIVRRASAQVQSPFAVWGDFNKDGVVDFALPFFSSTAVNNWGWRNWLLVVFQGSSKGTFSPVIVTQDRCGLCFDGILYHPARKQVEYWCNTGGGSFRWDGTRYVAKSLLGD